MPKGRVAQRAIAREVVRAVMERAVRGEAWAARAVRDALERDGRPPVLDQDALVEEGLGVDQILRRIEHAYAASGD